MHFEASNNNIVKISANIGHCDKMIDLTLTSNEIQVYLLEILLYYIIDMECFFEFDPLQCKYKIVLTTLCYGPYFWNDCHVFIDN